MKGDERQRNDPAVRAAMEAMLRDAVEQMRAARDSALAAQAAVLAIPRDHPHLDLRNLRRAVFAAARQADQTLDAYERILADPECFVGNMAAFCPRTLLPSGAPA